MRFARKRRKLAEEPAASKARKAGSDKITPETDTDS